MFARGLFLNISSKPPCVVHNANRDGVLEEKESNLFFSVLAKRWNVILLNIKTFLRVVEGTKGNLPLYLCTVRTACIRQTWNINNFSSYIHLFELSFHPMYTLFQISHQDYPPYYLLFLFFFSLHKK